MNKMYKIVFSIPVHEKPEVILDLVDNIIHFNPDCAIVLHISKTFSHDDGSISLKSLKKKLDVYPNVYINPNSLGTGRIYIKGLSKFFNHLGWGDGIFLTHLSNFNYVKDKVDFEYIMLLSSNELFVKKGTYQFIKKYVAGTQGYKRVVKENTKWLNGKLAIRDKRLRKVIKRIDPIESYICGGQVEGSWYNKKIFSIIYECVIPVYSSKKIFPGLYYAKEEIYYPTVLSHIKMQDNEVVYKGNVTNVLWGKPGMMADINDIKCTIKSEVFFSVKRIKRDINDPIRKYIKQDIGKGY